MLLTSVNSSDPEKMVGTSQAIQSVIGGQTYALVGFTISADLEDNNDLPELALDTQTVASAESSFGFEDKTIPLQPTAVSLDSDVAHVTVRNVSDRETSAWSGRGIILWLNQDGEITMGDSFSIDEFIPPEGGYRQEVPMSAVPDSDDRFIVGVFAKG